MKKRTSAKTYRARRRKAMVLGVGAAALKGALAFVGGKAAAAVGKGIAAMAMNPGMDRREREARKVLMKMGVLSGGEYMKPEIRVEVTDTGDVFVHFPGSAYPREYKGIMSMTARNPGARWHEGQYGTYRQARRDAAGYAQQARDMGMSAEHIAMMDGQVQYYRGHEDAESRAAHVARMEEKKMKRNPLLMVVPNPSGLAQARRGHPASVRSMYWRFLDPVSARAFADRSGLVVLLGDHPYYWVPKTMALAEQLLRSGYEPMPGTARNPGAAWHLREYKDARQGAEAKKWVAMRAHYQAGVIDVGGREITFDQYNKLMGRNPNDKTKVIMGFTSQAAARAWAKEENRAGYVASVHPSRYRGKWVGISTRHRAFLDRNPASDYTKKMAAKSEREFALKQQARGMTHAIVLPPGQGMPLYTASLSAATAMAKEYGRGTHVMPIDKFISSFGRNPGPAYHAREAKRYSSLLKDDVAAGHGGAAEYWQGALSAEAKASAVGKVGDKRPRKTSRKAKKVNRNIARSPVQVMAEMGASAKAQAVVRKFLAAQTPSVRAKLEGMTVDNLLELIHKHHTKK